MIRILIVDDQNLVQQGIKSLLDRDMDFKVIGTVKDGRNAVQQIAQIHPDIVLLDIEMPGMDGITTTKYINRVSPKTKVIILSSHEEKKYVTRALMAGARGYILKTSLMTDLKQAILAVNNGYSQIDSRLLAKVFDPQNVRSRKTNLDKKSNVFTQENLISQKSHKSLPDKNHNALENDRSEYSNLINPLKSGDDTSSLKIEKAETYESVILESDTTTQPETSTATSSTASEWKTKRNNLSNHASDSVVLKQVNPKEEETKSTKFKEYQRSYISSKTALKPFQQEPFEEQYKSNNLDLLLKQNTTAKADRIEKISDNPKISVHKPKMGGFKSQLEQFKTKLLLLVQSGRKRNLFWKIFLVILGIVVVVVLGS